MKKFLMVLGVIFLAIVAVAVLGVSIAAFHGTRLDKSSKAYVDDVTPVIITSWDAGALLDRASPEFLRVVTGDELDALFKICSLKLGPMKQYKGSKGDSSIKISPAGKVVTAFYIVTAAFEKAEGQIFLHLVRHGDKWQVLGFRVKSDALLR